MKIIVVALTGTFLAGSTQANLILLSESRSVSASGVAGGAGIGGQSYSQAQSSSPGFGGANLQVSGSADWIDTTPVESWYGLLGTYHADSRASQASSITSDHISVNASLGGSTSVALAGPYGPADSAASSVFEVSFSVLEPLNYSLDVSRGFFGHDLPLPEFDFFLDSAHHGTLWDNHNLTGFDSFSGILVPDTYTLRFNASIMCVADPLGDFKAANYGMDLHRGPRS